MKGSKPYLKLLQCPRCRSGALFIGGDAQDISCEGCSAQYPVVHGRPVLLRSDNAVFRPEEYRRAPAPLQGAGTRGGKRFIPDPSINLSRMRMMKRVRDILSQQTEAAVLVVGSGRQRQWLNAQLATSNAVRVIYSDVDAGADVDIYCDSHDLPFADGSFDAVITTAVLEHVLYPERVAAEIHRVLKAGGVLYSELPFMQQVHEGAYDFTRYTLSGHRRLLNGFSELESGMVAGPATALVWAIENFALAFPVRPGMRTATKTAVRLIFSWIKFFDRWIENRPGAMDGASCTYFLGRKIEGRVADTEIIDRYVGAKQVRHT